MASSPQTKKASATSDKVRSILGQYGIGLVLIIMMIVIAIMEPRFMTPGNIINVATQISINGLLCYGLCLCITTGGIDLTVGAQLALTSCIIGQTMTNLGWPAFLSIVAGVGVATCFGFIDGCLIAKFNMFPFVVTLSMQLVIRGLSQVITGGQAVMLTNDWFKGIYSNKLLGIPMPIIIFLVVTILMYLMLHWTKFGRYIFAVGGNVNAAIASGVSRFWVIVGVYTISGLLAGLASMIYTSKTGSAQSNIGVGYETDAIAAAVLGGTSFAGGIATIPGCVLGIFIIGLIYNGMNMIGVSSYYQSIVKGLIIIGAVMLDMVMNRNKH
ncbi:MAG: ABC transporter permease [Lachnospiraceae bacterium]|nr:ABC transporter permease [Lachnospiraceae bacterium]